MRIIHVHLDAAQGSVVVVPDPEVVFEGDEIVWEIRAPGRDITKVEFEIQKRAKKLRQSQKLQHERARLRFVAPKAKTKNKQPARYKYTGGYLSPINKGDCIKLYEGISQTQTS